jgi:hypothetical protein
MIGTILVVLTALIVAVFGCAWLRPDNVTDGERDTGKHQV